MADHERGKSHVLEMKGTRLKTALDVVDTLSRQRSLTRRAQAAPADEPAAAMPPDDAKVLRCPSSIFAPQMS